MAFRNDQLDQSIGNRPSGAHRLSHGSERGEYDGPMAGLRSLISDVLPTQSADQFIAVRPITCGVISGLKSSQRFGGAKGFRTRQEIWSARRHLQLRRGCCAKSRLQRYTNGRYSPSAFIDNLLALPEMQEYFRKVERVRRLSYRE
jgi:hypothetical protein